MNNKMNIIQEIYPHQDTITVEAFEGDLQTHGVTVWKVTHEIFLLPYNIIYGHSNLDE